MKEVIFAVQVKSKHEKQIAIKSFLPNAINIVMYKAYTANPSPNNPISVNDNPKKLVTNNALSIAIDSTHAMSTWTLIQGQRKWRFSC